MSELLTAHLFTCVAFVLSGSCALGTFFLKGANAFMRFDGYAASGLSGVILNKSKYH